MNLSLLLSLNVWLMDLFQQSLDQKLTAKRFLMTMRHSPKTLSLRRNGLLYVSSLFNMSFLRSVPNFCDVYIGARSRTREARERLIHTRRLYFRIFRANSRLDNNSYIQCSDVLDTLPLLHTLDLSTSKIY